MWREEHSRVSCYMTLFQNWHFKSNRLQNNLTVLDRDSPVKTFFVHADLCKKTKDRSVKWISVVKTQIQAAGINPAPEHGLRGGYRQRKSWYNTHIHVHTYTQKAVPTAPAHVPSHGEGNHTNQQTRPCVCVSPPFNWPRGHWTWGQTFVSSKSSVTLPQLNTHTTHHLQFADACLWCNGDLVIQQLLKAEHITERSRWWDSTSARSTLNFQIGK